MKNSSEKKMKTIVVMQECTQCGKRFALRYFDDGTFQFVTEPCHCDVGFKPIEGKPSLSEWVESIK